LKLLSKVDFVFYFATGTWRWMGIASYKDCSNY